MEDWGLDIAIYHLLYDDTGINCSTQEETSIVERDAHFKAFLPIVFDIFVPQNYSRMSAGFVRSNRTLQ